MEFQRHHFSKSQYDLLNGLLHEEKLVLDFSNSFVAEVYDPNLSHWESHKIGELHLSRRSQESFGVLYFEPDSRLSNLVKQLTEDLVSFK